MRKLFDTANRHIETSDWKIIAILKFCLVSPGIILGMGIRREQYIPDAFPDRLFISR